MQLMQNLSAPKLWVLPSQPNRAAIKSMLSESSSWSKVSMGPGRSKETDISGGKAKKISTSSRELSCQGRLQRQVVKSGSHPAMTVY